MGALDIFVTHGELIWLALLGASLVIGIVGPGLRGRVRARRRADVERDALGPPIAALDPGRENELVVVEGRLAVEEGPVHRVDDGAAAAAFSLAGPVGPREETPRGDRRAAQLVLETAAGRVVLEGPIEVRVGSRELRPLRRFEQLPDAMRERAKAAGEVDDDAQLIVRSVGDGDRVRARGVAIRTATGGEGTYRDAELGWTLRPAPTHDGEGRIVVIALERPAVRMPGRPVRLRAVVAAGLVCVGASWVVGAAAMSVAAGGSAAATRVAACTPFDREEALDEIERRLESAGRGMSAERIAVRALRLGPWGCGVATTAGDDPMGYAARITEACGTYLEHDRLALLYLNTGRLAAASDAASRARSLRSGASGSYMSYDEHLPLHLLAGDFEAAREAARLGAEYEAERDREEGHHGRRAARLECVSRAIDVRLGGDREDALEALRGHEDVPGCAILRAELLEGPDRIAALDACRECRSERTTRRVGWLWRFGARCADVADPECRALLARAPHWDAVERLTEGRPTYVGALPTFERELLARLDAQAAPPPTARVARVLSTLALAEYAAVTGDFEGAERLAARAQGELDALEAAEPDFWWGAEAGGRGPDAFAGLLDPPPPIADVARATRRLRVLNAIWSGEPSRALELARPDHPLRPLLEQTRGPRRTTAYTVDLLEDHGFSYVAGLLRMRVVFSTDLFSHIAETAIVGAILDREGRAAFLDGMRIQPTFPSQDARYNLNRRVRERVVLRALGAPERAADAEIEALAEAIEQPDRALLLHVVYD